MIGIRSIRLRDPPSRDGVVPARVPETTGRLSSSESLVGLMLVGAICAAIIVAHRPEAFTNPQLYAEDGQDWYAGAANSGWGSVLSPVAGYLTVFQRLVALPLVPLGLTGSALTFALVAISVQVLPSLVIASRRMRNHIPDARLRVAIAVLYAIIPNAELTDNLTNTQWNLAALAFLALVVTPPKTRSGKCFDLATLLLAGLTGPYALILLPLAAMLFRSDRSRWRRAELATIAGATVVQVSAMLVCMRVAPRPHEALGASLSLLVLIIGNQFFARFFAVALLPSALPLAGAIAAATIVLLMAGFMRGPRALRYFIVFAVLTAAAGILFPYDATQLKDQTGWSILVTGGASRYFFFLILALVLSAVAVAQPRPGHRHRRLARVPLVVLLVAVVVVSSFQFTYTALPPEHLGWYQARLSAAVPGTLVTIPIDPAGWTMVVRAGG